jgi:hypothetical protein
MLVKLEFQLVDLKNLFKNLMLEKANQEIINAEKFT